MAGRTSYPLPPHGTRERYQSRVDPCHCGQCRAANAAHQAARRAHLREGGGGVGRIEQLTFPPHEHHRIRVSR